MPKSKDSHEVISMGTRSKHVLRLRYSPATSAALTAELERIAPRSIGLGSETATKFSPLPSPGPETEWRPQQQASPGKLQLPTSIVTLSQLY